MLRLQKENPGQVSYFSGQDIFNFIPNKKYDLVYARAVPLKRGKRAIDLLKKLNPFLNPGAHIVVLFSEDWYEGPLSDPSQKNVIHSVEALKKSFSELGFSVLKIAFDYSVKARKQRAQTVIFLSQQKTLEKACVKRFVEDFLGNDKDLEDLTEFLEIHGELLQNLQKREEAYKNSEKRLRGLRSFSVNNPKRRYFDSLLVEQLRMCLPKQSSSTYIEMKKLEKSLHKPWKKIIWDCKKKSLR
jgi:hypothetical protein